jgi:Insertion element 4 transposase N-terminal/Transposase DDE domain
VLARTIPRELIDEVLAETDRREKRSRRLPAHVVVYFVIAMAIFRDSYEEVLRKLVNGLSFLGSWRDTWTVPTTGAISQARERLTELPMRTLFDRIAAPLAKPGTPGAWLRSWRLMAIDGVQIDVPDSDANLKEFGKYEGGTRRPFPQVHVVGLGECSTHAVVAAVVGTIYDGERKLAAGLLAAVSPGMLVLADRGFFSFELWAQYLVTGTDLLWRVTAGIKLPVTEVLPDGSYLSVINSRKTRSASYRIPLSAVDDPRDATHIPVRVIEYTVTGEGTEQSQTFRLITTILDCRAATAMELAAAYQQRWEYEMSLREIETQLLAPGQGLRSKTPELVRQEFWGLLLAHYAIRALMTEAADTAELDPDRLSFIRTLNIVRRQVTNQAGFSPRHIEPGTI